MRAMIDFRKQTRMYDYYSADASFQGHDDWLVTLRSSIVAAKLLVMGESIRQLMLLGKADQDLAEVERDRLEATIKDSVGNHVCAPSGLGQRRGNLTKKNISFSTQRWP